MALSNLFMDLPSSFFDEINSLIVNYLKHMIILMFSNQNPIAIFSSNTNLVDMLSSKITKQIKPFTSKQNIRKLHKVLYKIRNKLVNKQNQKQLRSIKNILNDIEAAIGPNTTLNDIIKQLFKLYNITNKFNIYQDNYTKNLDVFFKKLSYDDIVKEYGKKKR